MSISEFGRGYENWSTWSVSLDAIDKAPDNERKTIEKARILREAETAGRTIQDVYRERKISEQTFHRWKREFGILEMDQTKQLKELQKENARLERMLADEMLGKELMNKALEKKL